MDRTFSIEELLNEAGWLRRLAASLVGDEADDLVQDTWVAAMRRPPETSDEPRPWLARVARNLARNKRRHETRREARDELVHEERSNPRPDALALEAEAQRVLAEAVTRLDEPLRSAVVLRYFQGLDSNAAARRLGIPASTLRTRVQRALEQLRADLDRRFEGGRSRWMALFVPLVPRSAPAAATASAGGGFFATWTTALVGLAAAAGVTIAVAATWSSADHRRSSESAASVVAVAQATSADAVAEAASILDGRRAVVEGARATDIVPSSATAEDTSRLSGTILVDGATPQWPLELTLEPNVPSASYVLRKRVHPEHLTLAPEQHGMFVFEGLASDWSGRLVVYDYALASGESSLRIAAPIDGLVVDLRSGPEIVGRILEPDGAPASRIEGGYEIRAGISEEPANTEHRSHFTSRADGRFRIPCANSSDWCEVAFVVEEEARGYLHHTTPRFVASRGCDAGDLQLERLRSLAFTVRDPSGAPIANAFARVEGLTFRTFEPRTGADGTGVLELVPDRAADIRFDAFGYAHRVVHVEPGSEPEVVLEPLSVLEVRWRESIAARTERVVVRAPREAFVWDQDNWDVESEFQLALGRVQLLERHSPSAPGQPFEYEFGSDDERGFELAGVLPDVALTVEVLDSARRSLGFDTASVERGRRFAVELGDANAPSEPPASGLRKRRSP